MFLKDGKLTTLSTDFKDGVGSEYLWTDDTSLQPPTSDWRLSAKRENDPRRCHVDPRTKALWVPKEDVLETEEEEEEGGDRDNGDGAGPKEEGGDNDGNENVEHGGVGDMEISLEVGVEHSQAAGVKNGGGGKVGVEEYAGTSSDSDSDSDSDDEQENAAPKRARVM